MLNLECSFDETNNKSLLLDYWVNNKITDCSKVTNDNSRRKKPKVTKDKRNKSTKRTKSTKSTKSTKKSKE